MLLKVLICFCAFNFIVCDWTTSLAEQRILRAVKNADHASGKKVKKVADIFERGTTTIEADLKGDGYIYAVKNSDQDSGRKTKGKSESRDEFDELFAATSYGLTDEAEKDFPKGIQDILSDSNSSSSQNYYSTVQAQLPVIGYGGASSPVAAEQPQAQVEAEEEQPKFNQLIQININGQKVTAGVKGQRPIGDVPRPNSPIGNSYGSASPAQFPSQGAYGSASPVQFSMQGGYGSASPVQMPVNGGYGASQAAQFAGGYGGSQAMQFQPQMGYGASQAAQFPMQNVYGGAQAAQAPMQMGYGGASSFQAPAQMMYGSAQRGSYGIANAPVNQCYSCTASAPVQQMPSYGPSAQASPGGQGPSYTSSYRRSHSKARRNKFAELLSRSWTMADDDWSSVLNPPATRSKRSVGNQSPSKRFSVAGSLIDLLTSKLPDYASIDSDLIPLEKYKLLVFDFDDSKKAVEATHVFNAMKEKLQEGQTDNKHVRNPFHAHVKLEEGRLPTLGNRLAIPVNNQEKNSGLEGSSAVLVDIHETKQTPESDSTVAKPEQKVENASIPILQFQHDMSASDYKAEFSAANGIVSKEAGFLKVSSLPSKEHEDTKGSQESNELNLPVAFVKVGTVSWTSPEGVKVQLDYQADENGYHPTISKS